ncbi:MAG: type I 3-dehydroquinate dehydratase [Patescibacteria group bacterium]
MRICIPIRQKSLKKAIKAAQEGLKKASKLEDAGHELLFEVWLDDMAGLGDFIRRVKRPVIVVCRGPIEKGSFKGTEQERVLRLKEGIIAGSRFVDLGMQTHPRYIEEIKKVTQKMGASIIISQHFWGKMLPLLELIEWVKKAQKMGADIIKIAVTVNHWEDNVTLFELTRRASTQKIKMIVVGMGEKGKVSRMGCPLLGSYLTYVALSDAQKTAPGQWNLAEMVNFLDI